MIKDFYEFAGIKICVNRPEKFISNNQGALSNFIASPCENVDYEMKFEVVENLSEPVGERVFVAPDRQVFIDDIKQICYFGDVKNTLDNAYMRFETVGFNSVIEVDKSKISAGITSKMILNALCAEHLVIQNNGFLLHSSFIIHNKKAYLFTAPSGTGKSTQADLWCKYRCARLINGDRCVVMKKKDGVYACGVPFSGSSQVCENEMVPLSAIVYLKKADTNSVVQLKGFTAFRKVWEGCSVNVWNKTDVELCSQTILDVLQTVPVYELSCTPDEKAVITLESIMEK